MDGPQYSSRRDEGKLKYYFSNGRTIKETDSDWQ